MSEYECEKERITSAYSARARRAKKERQTFERKRERERERERELRAAKEAREAVKTIVLDGGFPGDSFVFVSVGRRRAEDAYLIPVDVLFLDNGTISPLNVPRVPRDTGFLVYGNV